MPDLQHTFGQDLTLSPTGGLALTDGTDLGQQRVLHRLLTNPSDYIWNLNYGAGLPGFIGRPTNTDRIAAVTRMQMYLESVVTRDPAPQITVTATTTGTVTLHILYVDAPSRRQQVLTFNLGA